MKKAIIDSQDVEQRLVAGESLRSIAKTYGITHQALSLRRRGWGGQPLRKTSRTAGNTFVDQWGYEMVRTDDMSRINPYVARHILVAEEKEGRRLRKGEVVHHVNGIKQHNDVDNLLVCTRSQHRKLHRQLEQLAYELVRSGQIVFENEEYQWAK